MNQINKLTWLVDTLRRHGRLSFEQINELWMDYTDFSAGEPLPKRTFHKWRQSILDTFGLLIECEKSGDFRYYISNADDMKDNSVEMWLLNSFTVCNSLIENRGMKDRIIMEDVPSGMPYLDLIIKAMRYNHCVEFVYHNYVRDDHKKHVIEPYFVKLFKRRWYVIGLSQNSGALRIFSLDRFDSLTILEDSIFTYLQDFSPEEFFRYNYGIYTSDIKPEQVKVKASAWQACYLRALPIMKETQEEIETTDEYSIFTFTIAPTYDFKQELLRMGDTIEVLEPKRLREEMKELIGKMKKMYSAKTKK